MQIHALPPTAPGAKLRRGVGGRATLIRDIGYVREWRSQRNLSTLKRIKLGHCPLLLATPQTGEGRHIWVYNPPPA